MNLQYRIDLLCRLGQYILNNSEEWQQCKERAERENGWFIQEFTDKATHNIAKLFLERDVLTNWATSYDITEINDNPKTVGIVMAGNIPLVGFHDLLCVFISGHKAVVKLSSKDKVLLQHLTARLIEWEPAVGHFISFEEMLKGCHAYIATGSNNSSRYFDFYFGKFPNIIRRNRTSVAILTGKETGEELEKLADDVFLFFGLGCRNVTKLYVPEGYNFEPLIRAFDKYNYLADHNKLKNNYDYNLALHILNKKYYMTNGSMLVIENAAIFSPISQLNYEFYSDASHVAAQLKENQDVQCIVGNGFTPFGAAQSPSITDYADGVDTLGFLKSL